MKKKVTIALVFAILMAMSCSTTGEDMTQSEREKLESEVNLAFEGLVEAAKSLSAEAYFSYFDRERLTALNENGTVTLSFDEFAKDYAERIKTFSGYESLTFKKVKITVLDNRNAVLVNEFDVKVALKSGRSIDARGAGTQVWTKKGSVWKLVHISASAR